MNTNKMNLANVINATELTPVSSAKLNECKALTSNASAITAVEQFAKLDVFDSKYNIKRCEVLAYAREQLKDEQSLTFKKMCEVFGLDDSNAGKMATIWDMFYKNGEPFTLFSVSQLTPFTSKRIDDVMKVFEQSAITPSLSVKDMRAIAKCIDSKHGIIDNGRILDILNGDITTEDKSSKADSKADNKADSKADSKPYNKVGGTMDFTSVDELMEYLSKNPATIDHITVTFK